MHISIRRISAVMVIAVTLSSCVVIPPHDGLARVPLDHIVKLVKCDLMNSIRAEILEQQDRQRPRRLSDNRFAFLAEWAAKVHLTIAVDDTGSVNPGATFIDPKAIAGTSFSVGAGGGMTTEAVRQEDVEFFLSFSEIGVEFAKLERGTAPGMAKYDFCAPADGLLLESNLGLKPMLDMALKPVEQQTLTRGDHAGLAASPSPALQSANKTLEDYLTNIEARPPPAEGGFKFLKNGKLVEAPIGADPQVAADQAQAERLETDAQAIIKNIVAPLYDLASSSLPKACLEDKKTSGAKSKHGVRLADAGLTTLKGMAVIAASTVSVRKLAVDDAKSSEASGSALKSEKDSQTETVNAAMAFVKKMEDCAAHPPKEEKPLYDPLSTISETINFYITFSGSVTPTWKLVRVTAPLAPTFLSASRKDTNTLIIVMGRPDTTNGKAATASAAMNNQLLALQLAQAVQSSPALH
jgi:hypothetical protein